MRTLALLAIVFNWTVAGAVIFGLLRGTGPGALLLLVGPAMTLLSLHASQRIGVVYVAFGINAALVLIGAIFIGAGLLEDSQPFGASFAIAGALLCTASATGILALRYKYGILRRGAT